MAQKGDVELIIRAKNDATKSLDQITSSLKSLKDQQVIVGDSAAKTDGKLNALGAELAKLRTNAQNLQAVANIATVLDKATGALERQRAAVADAAATQSKLTGQQQKLAAEQAELAQRVKDSTSSLAQQSAALDKAKAAAAGLSKESTTLNGQERTLERSLGSVTNLIAKQEAALTAARQKHAEMAAAVDATDKPTKRLTNSLEAAERALVKRQQALDASRAKEAGLQSELAQAKAAQDANRVATEQAAAALKAQAQATDQAKAAVSDLNAQNKGLSQSQAAVAKEVANGASALDQLQAQLNTAETEYAQVKTTADAARQAIAVQAASSTEAGQAAAQASIELATFAARMKALQAAGQGTTSTNALGFSPEDVSAATSAISNAQKVIRAAGDESSKAAVSADELTAAIKAAGDAGSQLSRLGTAVTQQQQAVDGAQAAWKAAEAEVRRLAMAMRDADQPSEALAAALGNAQAQARLAKTEFQNQQQAAARMATSLQQAGQGVGTLNSAEAALRLSVQSANSAVQQGASAAQSYSSAASQAGSGANRFAGLLRTVSSSAVAAGSGVLQAGRAVGKFREDVRSATSATTSFGGELRGLVTSLAGIYAIKSGLESMMDTSNQMDAAGARFRVGFGGNVEAASKEMDYGVTVAKNLKLPILDLVTSYSQLSIAAQGTKLQGQGARDIFTAFAQAARVNRMSNDELKGSFQALTQIMSKGTVQAEELRGQLGDRMPGAIQIMASALGVSTEKLTKMMEQGQLTSETLQFMAAEVSRRVAPELATALDSPQAKIQAFKNSWMELELQLARSGFLDAIATSLQTIGQALSAPEVVEGVKSLGRNLAELINWVMSLGITFDDVALAAKTFFGLWAVNTLAGAIATVAGLARAFLTLAPAIWAALAPLSPFLIAIGAVAAIFAAPWLYNWAYENFPAFAEGVMTIQAAAGKAWDGIVLGWNTAGATLTASFMTVINYINQKWAELLSYLAGSAAKIGNAVGFDGMNQWANEMEAEAKAAAAGTTKAWSDGQKEIDAERQKYADKALAREKQLADDIAAYQKKHAKPPKIGGYDPLAPLQGAAAAGNVLGMGQINAPGTYTPPAGKDKKGEAAARKRKQLEEQVANEMYGIRAQLEKKSADTLDEALAAVPAKYAKLYDKLRALGKDQNSEEWKTVDALVAQEQQIVKNTWAKKGQAAETKKQQDSEKYINDLMSLRRDLLEQIKYAESHGDSTTATKLKEQLTGVNAQLKEAIDKQIAYWDSVGGPKADLAIAKLKATKDSLQDLATGQILTAANAGQQLGQSLMSWGDNFLTLISQGANVFDALKESFQQFASSFLLEMAKMILKQALFNALQSAASSAGGGMWGTVISAAASAVGSAHTGGIAGSPTLNQRSASPGMFANATRYHTGGVVGLQPWEVPIIAKKNEEVLTENDPRHINNLGKGGDSTAGGNGNMSSGTTIINAIDSDSVVQAGLSTPAGQQKIINIIRANKQTLKSILG